MNKFDYENTEYLDKLNQLPADYYSKYVEYIEKYLDKNSKFLDVGCGNGEVLEQLKKDKFTQGYGIDISKLFVKEAKSRGLANVYSYDGSTFPFKKNFFEGVGSFNVLEHTQDPNKFIKSQIELLKPSGYLIIACPNFLSSVIMSPHPKVKGIGNKLRNFSKVLYKLIDKNSTFASMPIIKRKNFQYDDDAIVVTNLIDLKRALNKYNCKVVYESGFINYNTKLFRMINSIPIIRYSLPSCFVIAQKNNV